ncbi:MAG TPA: DUF2795 domain-containing protein [Actinomycetes bacterium]
MSAPEVRPDPPADDLDGLAVAVTAAFPGDRDRLLRVAARNGAPLPVLALLGRLPGDRVFRCLEDVLLVEARDTDQAP